eukprot:5857200-Karenia_brevis.AAC.1
MLSYALAHHIRVRLRDRARQDFDNEDDIGIQAQAYYVPLDPYRDKQTLGQYVNDSENGFGQ